MNASAVVLDCSCDNVGVRLTVWDGKLQHNLQQFNPANLPKFSGIPGQSRDQHGARQSVYGSTDRVDSCGVERRGEERGSSYLSATQSPRQISHTSQAGYEPESGVSELQEKLMALDSLHQSNMSSRSGDRQFRSEQSGSEKLAAKLFPHTGPSRSVTLENGTTLDSLSSGALVQLSNKTGQRLLETAIQSSFTYRAMGLQGPVAQPTGGPSSRVGAGGLSGEFGRPYAGGRTSFPEFLVKKQGQNDSERGSGMTVDGVKGSRLEQDSNRAFQMQEPGTSFVKQHPVHKPVLEDCRGSVAGPEPERQNSRIDRNVREWQSEEPQGTVNDRHRGGRSQGGPEADSIAKPALESKVHDAVIPSRLSQGLVDSEGNKGEHSDGQIQPLAGRVCSRVVCVGVGMISLVCCCRCGSGGPCLGGYVIKLSRFEVASRHGGRLTESEVAVAELAGRDVRGVEMEAVSVQEALEVATLSGGDIQCSCLKCRKASPSIRGQAVPR